MHCSPLKLPLEFEDGRAWPALHRRGSCPQPASRLWRHLLAASPPRSRGGWPRLAAALAAALVVSSAGCRPHDHDHDHEEPESIQLTVWTNGFEVFAEHLPPAAGQPTRFITHVTDLGTFEPRREGPVTFVLRQGDAVVEHPQAAPARAGIYLPDLVFPKAGEWRLSLRVPAGGTNAEVDLGAIQVHADPHAAQHATVPPPPEGVAFLKEQQWQLHTRIEPAAKRRVVERVRLPARVRARPGLSSAVLAPVSGQLAAPPGGAGPRLGSRVEAGQLLALLRPNFAEATARLAEAGAEFATAKAALEQAEAAYQRTRKLVAEEAKSPRELQEAELLYRSAQARYAAARGLLQTFRQATNETHPDEPLVLELRAPITGVLHALAAGPGEVVAAGQNLFSVLDAETVWVEAAIPEASVDRLSPGKEALLETPGSLGQFSQLTGEGQARLVSLGLEVDPVTRTVPLIYEVPNQDARWRPGQWVTLLVETARAEEALAIPDSALVAEGGRTVAFVQLAGETFEKRELKLGIRDGHWVQVRAGIQPGERVVTEGAFAIRLASVSGALPSHGHAH